MMGSKDLPTRCHERQDVLRGWALFVPSTGAVAGGRLVRPGSSLGVSVRHPRAARRQGATVVLAATSRRYIGSLLPERLVSCGDLRRAWSMPLPVAMPLSFAWAGRRPPHVLQGHASTPFVHHSVVPTIEARDGNGRALSFVKSGTSLLTDREREDLRGALSVRDVVAVLGVLRRKPAYQWDMTFPTSPGRPPVTIDVDRTLEQLVDIWQTTMKLQKVKDPRYTLSGLVAEAGSGKTFIMQHVPQRVATLFQHRRNAKRKLAFAQKLSFLAVNFNSTFSVRGAEVKAIKAKVTDVADLWRLRVLFHHYVDLRHPEPGHLFDRFLAGVHQALFAGALTSSSIAGEVNSLLRTASGRPPGGCAVLLVDEPAKVDDNVPALREFIYDNRELFILKDGTLPALPEILLASMCAAGDCARVCVCSTSLTAQTVVDAATPSGRSVKYADLSRDDPPELAALLLDGLIALSLKRMYLSRSSSVWPGLNELVALCDAHATASSSSKRKDYKRQIGELLWDTAVGLSHCSSGHMRGAVYLGDAVGQISRTSVKSGSSKAVVDAGYGYQRADASWGRKAASGDVNGLGEWAVGDVSMAVGGNRDSGRIRSLQLPVKDVLLQVASDLSLGLAEKYWSDALREAPDALNDMLSTIILSKLVSHGEVCLPAMSGRPAITWDLARRAGLVLGSGSRFRPRLSVVVMVKLLEREDSKKLVFYDMLRQQLGLTASQRTPSSGTEVGTWRRWEVFAPETEVAHSIARSRQPDQFAAISLKKLMAAEGCAYAGNGYLLEDALVDASRKRKGVVVRDVRAILPRTVADDEILDYVYQLPENFPGIDAVMFFRCVSCPRNPKLVGKNLAFVIQYKHSGAEASTTLTPGKVVSNWRSLERELFQTTALTRDGAKLLDEHLQKIRASWAPRIVYMNAANRKCSTMTQMNLGEAPTDFLRHCSQNSIVLGRRHIGSLIGRTYLDFSLGMDWVFGCYVVLF